MFQELFRIPYLNLPIYSYGLMMVIGVFAAIHVAKFLAKRSGLDPETFVNAGLLALVAGIAGARLSHVIENIGQYTDPTRSAWTNLLDAINIRSGGLTYYGGFLAAFPTLVIFGIKKKIPLRLGMDICAPAIVIGLGFGRIGCFLNGCCYGDHCELPWAVRYPYQSLAYEEEYYKGELGKIRAELLVDTADTTPRLLTRQELKSGFLNETGLSGQRIPIAPKAREYAAAQQSKPLHPAQLYSAFTAFLIGGILLCYFTLPHAPGRGFAMMLMLEGGTRFILEMLRVEPPVVGYFSLSMIIGISLATIGAVLWIMFGQFSAPTNAGRGFPVGQSANVT